MPTDQQVSDSDVFKAIGHLEEATKSMQIAADHDVKDSEEIIGFFATIGKIIKEIFLK